MCLRTLTLCEHFFCVLPPPLSLGAVCPASSPLPRCCVSCLLPSPSVLCVLPPPSPSVLCVPALAAQGPSESPSGEWPVERVQSMAGDQAYCGTPEADQGTQQLPRVHQALAPRLLAITASFVVERNPTTYEVRSLRLRAIGVPRGRQVGAKGVPRGWMGVARGAQVDAKGGRTEHCRGRSHQAFLHTYSGSSSLLSWVDVGPSAAAPLWVFTCCSRARVWADFVVGLAFSSLFLSHAYGFPLLMARPCLWLSPVLQASCVRPLAGLSAAVRSVEEPQLLCLEFADGTPTGVRAP